MQYVRIASGDRIPGQKGRRRMRRSLAAIVTGLVSWGPLERARAENQLSCRYQDYAEEDNRMHIETHSAYFEQQLTRAATTKVELVYDGISGSTPTGTYRISPTSGLIRTVELRDVREAVNVELDGRLANHTITPGFAYSTESNYTSYGISLSDAMDFNQKNTTL